MAGTTRVALIAAFAALAGSSGACTVPKYSFSLEDVSAGAPAPESRILVGEHAVVRLESDGGPRGGWDMSAFVDVFPAGAELRGAWVKMSGGGRDVCEGPAAIYRRGHEPRYFVRWPGDGERCVKKEGAGARYAITWIGPVCVREGCETFRVGESDWPRRP